jgi:hypothetical protein
MDVSAKLDDALRFLAPHFGSEPVVLGEFLSADPTIANYQGPNEDCAIFYYAGEMAGHHFYTKCNNDRVKDDSILALLQNTASKYAGNAYHASRCTAMHYSLRTHNTDVMLGRFIDTALHPELLRDDQKLFNVFQAINLAEPLGRILYKKHGASKLGEFARMGINDALRFLTDSAGEVLPDSKRF